MSQIANIALRAHGWIRIGGLIGFLSAVMPATALELYVSTSGSDADPGTIDRPYRTISKAAAAARPGTDIFVRGGRYDGVVRIYNDGSASKPIRLQPYQREKVVIDGATTKTDTDLVLISANHVIFRNFEVVNATRTGICAWGTHGVHIVNNTIQGSVRGAIWVGHSAAGKSSQNLVEGNVARANAIINSSRTRMKGWPVTIAVAVSDHTVVRNNIVYQNFGEGIGVLSSRGVTIQSNRVFDNYSVMIYLDNAPATVVKNNVVYSSGDARYFRQGRPANGVLVANEFTAIQLPSKGIRIESNKLIGVGDVSYGSYERGGGLRQSVIRDNIVVVAVEGPVKIQ
ncbi:MAG: right-handed parallel beta-helix repeat-containing protein [Candidatus Kaistia colombiensis]|nr:MAG: right-handed parallel beta-helix repeat-containing protein [Kaistia sp.]